MIVICDGHRRCSTDVTSWPISHQGKKVNLYLMYYFPFDIPGRRKSSNPVLKEEESTFRKKGLLLWCVCVWMEATNAAGKPSHVCGSSSSVIVSILQKCLWREERSYKKTSSTLTLENKTEARKFLHPLYSIWQTLRHWPLFALHLRLFHLGSKLVFWQGNGL